MSRKALSGKPFEDISALQTVSAVYRAGNQVV